MKLKSILILAATIIAVGATLCWSQLELGPLGKQTTVLPLESNLGSIREMQWGLKDTVGSKTYEPDGVFDGHLKFSLIFFEKAIVYQIKAIKIYIDPKTGWKEETEWDWSYNPDQEVQNFRAYLFSDNKPAQKEKPQDLFQVSGKKEFELYLDGYHKDFLSGSRLIVEVEYATNRRGKETLKGEILIP